MRHHVGSEALLKDFALLRCNGSPPMSVSSSLDGVVMAPSSLGWTVAACAKLAVTPGTVNGQLCVCSQPTLCTAAAPAVGPCFSCHGAVLGGSVRCGTAGALCPSLVWYLKREGTFCSPQVYHKFCLLLAGLPRATVTLRWAWLGPFCFFRLGKHVLGEEVHAV